MNDFAKDFADYVLSGHAMLRVSTFEKDRAITDIKQVANTINRQVHIWSIAEGWTDADANTLTKLGPEIPVSDHLAPILSFDERTICILKDFGSYLQSATYPQYDVVIGYLDMLKRIVPNVEQTIVFVGPNLEIPQELLHDIATIDFPLPDGDKIKERIEFTCSGVQLEDGKTFECDPDLVPHIVDACRGMTSQQVVDRVALAMRKHGGLDHEAVRTITGEKAKVISESGLLTYIEPPSGGLSSVGGYERIKKHVELDKPCFTQEARDFGIEFPRGLMLVGIPGCGKTLISIGIASELNLPLISMDVGNIMSKFVGESERHIREAIQMVESMSPCVLQLDEIEKGFGGAGDMDGGASRRVFGTFLKWLNDRRSPVYAVATANQVQSLPPEFCRKGRFDEIYGLDLPQETEREEIFRIHLSKRERNPGDFDINKLALVTEGYTGADIEQIIKLGLKMAFANKRNLITEHLEIGASEIIPLSQTEADRITSTREWCERHAKQANPLPKKKSKSSGQNRRITLQ